ncbi:MAG: AAA family ATPase [Aggregatilineales bacterium]
MLKRVHIRNYKSLEDVEVHLQPLSVLFGPNAAGKSNFLDALQLLSRIVTSRTLKDAFEPPYRGKPLESFTFGLDGIRGLLKQESVSFSIEADIELSQSVVDTVNRQIREMKRNTKAPEDNDKNGSDDRLPVREKNLRYRIEIEILPRTGILRVTDEFLAALNADGQPTGGRRPFLEQMRERLHLRMEGQAHPTYYDLHLDHSLLSTSLYPPYYPHLVAARQELANWSFFYFEPRERMRVLNPVKEVRHIGLMGEELAAFLNTLRALEAQQFRAIEKALHLIIPSIDGIEVFVNEMGEVELRLLEDGKPIPARVVSEGTLRILGLLALQGVKEPSSLIGLEEPENGVHPRRIRLIAEWLRNRASSDTQVIVTTHSPVLLDLIPDKSLYACLKDSRGTVISPYKSSGELWRDHEIEQSMDDHEGSPELAVSERILRGDFDG